MNVEAAESVVPGPNRSRASSCAASTARSHGTQSLPQCDTILAPVALAVASWRFFATRIPFEEGLLRRMFPGEYEAYAARTRTWIPGIP